MGRGRKNQGLNYYQYRFCIVAMGKIFRSFLCKTRIGFIDLYPSLKYQTTPDKFSQHFPTLKMVSRAVFPNFLFHCFHRKLQE
jgi:hypothetical protein